MLLSEGAIALSDIQVMTMGERQTFLYAFREQARLRDEEIERRANVAASQRSG